MESQQALQKGDLSLAKKRCEEALEAAPKLATAHQLAAAIAVRQGQEPRAQRHLRRFLELQPTHVEGWFSLGNSCRRGGAIREAEIAYRQALHVDLQHGASRRALVSLLTEQGHGDAAVAIAEAGLRYAPSDLKLRALLGEALLATEAFEPALAQFAEALKADPTFAAALQGKALALRGLDRPEEALALLEALETQGLTHFSIAHNMGNVLSDLGRLEAAAQAYETAIARNPGYGSSYSNLARTLWCLGDQKGFLAGFEQAFASGRHDPPLIKAYLDALLAVGDRETFNTARRAFPAAVLEGPALQDTLARASAQAGDFAAARRHHHNALAHPEAPVQWHCHAAQSDLLAGDPEAAATRLDAALRREPGNGFLLAYLGVAWTQLGDPRAEQLLATDLIHEQDLGVPPGFSTYEEFQRALKAELAQEHTANQHPFEQTLRGGTQTQGNILRLKTPAVRALRLQLERAVEHSLATLRAREAPPPHGQFTVPGPWRFSGAWSVMLKPGGFHTMHVHPMGFYSAVYYVEAPPKDPSAPHAGWLQFGPPDLALPAEVPIRKLIEPIAGRIALFPSYFWHGTRPFTLGTHRTTVAFDVVGRPAPES
jgi:tetratricopeptide (TPR) repeat protein